MKKEELIRMREELGLTRRELADRLFIDYKTIYAYEMSIRPISKRTAAMMHHLVNGQPL